LANSGFLGPLAGRFYDRFGCTRTLLLGGLLSVIGLFASSFAPNSSVLILTFGMVFGLGSSFNYFGCLLVIPQYFEKYTFQATSLVSAAPGAALLIMIPIIQRLYQAFGWRKTMRCMAAMAFIPCIVGLTMCVRKDNRKTPRYIEQNQSEIQPAKTKCNLNKLVDVSVFKNKVFVLTSIMVTVAMFGHTMPFVHIVSTY
jgi:MCP family monocarboxylic acid transporter-like MFS transporter 10